MKRSIGYHHWSGFWFGMVGTLFSLALAETHVAKCSPNLQCYSAWPEKGPSLLYFQGHTHGEVMSAVPNISGFIFHFKVFFLYENKD